jgi:hypothetical protein
MELNRVNRVFILFSISICLINLFGCSYSFTGASVPPHLKTISIPLFIDRSGSGEFDLSERLTNGLTRKFIDDNTLTVGDKLKSDSIIEGTIVSLADAPAVLSGADKVGENITSRRITITVKAVYRDLIKRQIIFERNFSNYGDYPVNDEVDIITVRRKAIETAIDRITEDILLGVVSNW